MTTAVAVLSAPADSPRLISPAPAAMASIRPAVGPCAKRFPAVHGVVCVLLLERARVIQRPLLAVSPNTEKKRLLISRFASVNWVEVYLTPEIVMGPVAPE